MSTSKLKSKLESLKTRKDKLQGDLNAIYSEIRALEKEIAEVEAPFASRDIVEDELGVRYRVTSVRPYGPNREYVTYGIRLTKNGTEAYRDGRIINSDRLVKVEV